MKVVIRSRFLLGVTEVGKASPEISYLRSSAIHQTIISRAKLKTSVIKLALLALAIAVAATGCSERQRANSQNALLPPLAFLRGMNAVYLLSPNGRERYVTNGDGVAWTANHKMLFVQRTQYSNPPRSEVWLASPDGKFTRKLTDVYPDQVRFFAAGSSGTKSFLVYDTDKTGVQLINLSGPSGASIDLQVKAFVDSLSVSPNGSQVALVTEATGNTTPALYIKGITGASPLRTVLAETKYQNIGQVSWSPNGKWLAFGMTVQRGLGDITVAVWLIHPDGQGLHMLTLGSDPVWSPDGKWIAFVKEKPKSIQPPLNAVFMIHPNGTDQTQLIPYGNYQGIPGFDALSW